MAGPHAPASALALAATLLPLLLAGCAGGGGDGAGDGAGSRDGRTGASVQRGDGDGPPDSAPMPEWAVGDAWTYDFNGEETTYVIAGETATDWIMETDSAERSFSDLRDDISRLGPQRKSDLAGSQGDDRVEFFRWPLQGGQQWTTRWDGLDVEVRVLGGDSTFQELEARVVGAADDDPPLYRYTYDAEARWFGELRRFAPDGSAMVTLTLTAAVRGWSGTLVRWTLAPVVEDTGSDPAQPPLAGGPFEVPSGTTDIWAEYHFACGGNGGYLVAVEPANPGLAGNQGSSAKGQCTEVDFAGALVAGPHAGTWTFAVSAGGQTIDYSYAILLRTRQDVPFP